MMRNNATQYAPIYGYTSVSGCLMLSVRARISMYVYVCVYVGRGRYQLKRRLRVWSSERCDRRRFRFSLISMQLVRRAMFVQHKLCSKKRTKHFSITVVYSVKKKDI